MRELFTVLRRGENEWAICNPEQQLIHIVERREDHRLLNKMFLQIHPLGMLDREQTDEVLRRFLKISKIPGMKP